MKKIKKKYWAAGIIACLIIVFTASASFMVKELSKKKELQTYVEMSEKTKAKDISKDEDFSVKKTEKTTAFIPEKDINWDELRKKNKDIYAWIYIPDVNIDYPVCQHDSDNEYYLNHNLDGSSGLPGVIYSENYNSKDFLDVHTLLYGHNTKDGSMFSALHDFEDENFFNKEEHYIYIYTSQFNYVYEIFAAYIYNDEHLILNYDLDNEYVYEQYIKDIYTVSDKGYGKANIKNDITVTKENKIITLSTCLDGESDGYRYLVTGVLKNEPKDD
ncbi:sortase B [Acetitomaculum ruminis DSM 5522]|uniref:Sortase B n=1 Tax=Acetitomaculum ruminis DSM 5522 TaxID=1120918 RepID=A0A1I0VL41_9FIRM|nr:class B sortase [Acetitomaculum ruminis]SFA76743.1 sortase B [Acetitomaculum ruminis DSM 5522]